ncbi:MAG: OmpA family protein [Acidimicrobiales bacterium]
MADQDEARIDRGATGDDPERRRPGRGPTLGEEGSDDLPALLAFAVGIAVIVVIVWQSGAFGPSTPMDAGAVALAEAADDVEVDAPTDTPTDTTVADDVESDGEAAADLTDAELAGLVAELEAAGFTGLILSADGRVVTARGEVADEGERAGAIAALAGLSGVESVIDELMIAAAADDPAGTAAEATVTASQALIVLAGAVPSQALIDELVARVAAIYAGDQIDNQLTVDEAMGVPVRVTVTGSMTDPVLHQAVTTAFDGVVGVEVDATGVTLKESSDVETALNELQGVQFNSGSALIRPESAPILDQAAELLVANPALVVEVGGHTDSTGTDESNQRLSQARAESVVAELTARGVTNQLVPRGFGESRLRVDPEDTVEAQQANRRIEFRVMEG